MRNKRKMFFWVVGLASVFICSAGFALQFGARRTGSEERTCAPARYEDFFKDPCSLDYETAYNHAESLFPDLAARFRVSARLKEINFEPGGLCDFDSGTMRFSYIERGRMTGTPKCIEGHVRFEVGCGIPDEWKEAPAQPQMFRVLRIDEAAFGKFRVITVIRPGPREFDYFDTRMPFREQVRGRIVSDDECE